MEFWNIFNKLCEKRKIKPSQIAKEINVTPGTMTGWKKGSPPNSERLCAIADYFGVTTDYLLGRSEADPQLPEDQKRLLNNYVKADERGKTRIQKTAEEEANYQEPQKQNVS